MSPCLEDCPNEIIETIVVLLDLDDIRSLRQSCRSLAAKTTQNHFKSYYHSKRVDITLPALRAFVDVTQPGRLGCLVQELILVGLTNGAEGQNSKPQYGPAETELDLLSQAFNGIAANRKSGQHLSLSLKVAVVQDDAKQRLLPADVARGGWKFVWQSAAQTFHTTLRALAASRLPLEKLDVFNDRQSQSCSIACDELGRVDFQDKGLAISLSSLKSLSISLSDKIIEELPPPNFSQPPKEKDIREAKKKATARSNFVGLVKLLQLTRLLDSLEIHYYRLDTAGHLLRPFSAHHERLLKQVAGSENLPKLKQCRLRGIYISDGDLLAFIQRTATRRLFIEKVDVSSGTFRSIFDYCTRETTGIEELYFDYLIEKGNLLYFPPPDQVGHTQVPRRSTTSLQRVGAKVKQPIIYHYHQGRTEDTPRTRALQLQRRREYGPL
ncbi:hypothetical protein M430DRAFT_63599 [Amorphotheca resinae ATCC 22711]|uniref:F-box domain-containing protein n=1 Tax=Amorphotheca resinae ATCC 22711 TaxID=857342 RepID=A0A2T3B9E4_AMORE|nr:hypothetical protein M430DRAFT_63599 [Amorphotheca resinae ATCC 22711]PSS24942.1 hypothetical protein M430DRAFT_63599 [Amorphotheca resinae ATCC 22711]